MCHKPISSPLYRQAIELMVTRDVMYKPKFIEWANQMLREMKETVQIIKDVLGPCDAIVVIDAAVAHDPNAAAKAAYESVIRMLDSMVAQVGVILEQSMDDGEVARKGFNEARKTFNGAQSLYRVLGDIGQTAMFDYCDQLIHVMAQLMGTMGRGFATGHLPKEPGPPQITRQYPGRLTDEDARQEIAALTDSERPVLTDGARAWMEPYLFLIYS
jgi:hypothetical protein